MTQLKCSGRDISSLGYHFDMPNKSTAFFILVTFSIGAILTPAQDRSTIEPLPTELSRALQTIHADRIIHHVKALASDEFEGRAPGTRGEILTVNYISRQFKNAGLLPGNPDGTFVQKVPLIGYKTTASIELNTKNGSV